MNRGRFFRIPPARNGLGELPSTPLNENGAMAVQPPYGRPPIGNLSAPSQVPGEMRQVGESQSSWAAITFFAKVAPTKIQDYTYRKFLVIQNKSAAGTLFVGFGWEPNESNGLVLPPGVGYEPFSYPTNEIYVTSDGPTVSGLMIYGV